MQSFVALGQYLEIVAVNVIGSGGICLLVIAQQKQPSMP